MGSRSANPNLHETGKTSGAASFGVSSLVASEVDMLLDEKPAPALLYAGYAVALFFIALIGVASFVKTDIVVQGQGELTMDSPAIVLQPFERAAVRSIKVKSGDFVAAGQIVAELDATFVEADITSLKTQLQQAQVQVLRLQAEVNGEAFRIPPEANEIEKLQHAIAVRRQEQYASRVSAFDEELRRIEATHFTLASDQGLINQQLDIAKEVEGMRSRLLEMQAGSRLHQLESQNARLRTERDHQDAINRQNEAQHLLQARKSERQEFIDRWKREALEELNQKTAESAKLSDALAKAERLQQLVVLTAPVDAYVLEVANRSQGSVVREAEPVVTLVPSHGTMIANVWITSKDIGYIKDGDEVRIKVDAFPFQRHGSLRGYVRSITKSSYSSNQTDMGLPHSNGPQTSMHRSIIRLTDTTLDRLPQPNHLIPGMTVSAEIKIGTRSVLSYFIDPLLKGLDESIREP